ncbi:MAG: D-glycero-beta-D-manno-heptose 1-phosphate adenylyltransferase [Vampirovibrionales bacterium]|nr:D-glycero-beta-D-manno-heptose 1-phosphate adenylyltransferase [Vampirovibrionales bacterium]
MSAGDLAETLALARAGKRVATTNGCFDLLHVGHLRYLQAARAMGDLLIVAINSDASVRALKGPSRPLVSQDDRAELLAGLRCVDYVVIFDAPTPLDVLTQIRPDVHVKGGDYDADTLPEAAALRALGVELAFVPLVSGKSTTALAKRLSAGV